MEAPSHIPFGHEITLDEVKQNFEFFDDWEDRYRFIIDLGKQLPPLPDSCKVPENIVHGCQSQVWVVQTAARGPMEFALDSDAYIVRGLIAIVLSALNGRPAEEVVAWDPTELFDELELLSHLSPARGNGLNAMVKRIQSLARERLAATG